jgi:hypothetical protein
LGGIIRRREGRRGKKAINVNKTTEVLQGPDDGHSQFDERLCKYFHLYTSFNPEDD